MNRKLVAGFFLAWCLVACNNESPAGANQGTHTSCIPGSMFKCTCIDSGLSGVRLCLPNGKWSACDCRSDVVWPADGLWVEPDAAGGGPPPAAGPLPASFVELAGGANLSSSNFRLKLFVAPARPVEKLESSNYRLILGPGGPVAGSQ